MRNWMKRGMALMLAGVVMLSGASAGKVQATEDKKDTTSGDNVIIQEVEKEPDGPSSTSEFLTLSDAFQTPTVTHGQRVVIGLPVVNYSTVPLKDVVIKPRISNLVSEWPFEPNAAGATKAIKSFPAYDNKKNIEDMRQEIGFEFVVRSDVKSGYYKLEFDATYTRNGQVEKAVLTSYVKAVGTEESGSLDGDAEGDKEQVSKPRIIVTGLRLCRPRFLRARRSR